jgi:CBS-domain-containing membrane protein
VIRGVAEGADPKATKIADVVSRDLVTVEPDQDLDETLALMARHQVRRLPVARRAAAWSASSPRRASPSRRRRRRRGELLEQISRPTSTARE